MLQILFAIFIILHGLVHLLYAGQSQRLFELTPGMIWPDSSWAFSRLAGVEATRILAAVLLAIGAVLFVAAGGGLLLKANWWRSAVMAAAGFSTLIYVLLWDGGFQSLADKGAVGILINAAIVVVAFVASSAW